MKKLIFTIALCSLMWDWLSPAFAGCHDFLIFLDEAPEASLPHQLRRSRLRLSLSEGLTRSLLNFSKNRPAALKGNTAAAVEDLLLEKQNDKWSIRLGQAYQSGVVEKALLPFVEDFTVVHTLVEVCTRLDNCVLRSPKNDSMGTFLAVSLKNIELQYSQIAQPIRKTLVGAAIMASQDRLLADRSHVLEIAKTLKQLLPSPPDEAPTWVDESGRAEARGSWMPLDRFESLATLYESKEKFYEDLALFLILLKDREGLNRLSYGGDKPITAQELLFRFMAKFEEAKAKINDVPSRQVWSNLKEGFSSNSQIQMDPQDIRDLSVFMQFIQNFIPLENGIQEFAKLYEGFVIATKTLGTFLAPVDQLKTLMDASRFLQSGHPIVLRVTWDTSQLTRSPRLETQKGELLLATGMMLTGSTNILPTSLIGSDDMVKEAARLDAGQQIQAAPRPGSGVSKAELPQNPEGALASSFTVDSVSGLMRLLTMARLPSIYRSYARSALMNDPNRPTTATAFLDSLRRNVRVEWAPASTANASSAKH